MKKFISYEKLSKKEKRKIDQARRQTWGELNPVTRKPANSKAYNRNKARNWKREYHEPIPGLLYVKLLFFQCFVDFPFILLHQQKVDVQKLQPITYDPMNHHYLILGEKVGQAFHDGLALK